MSSPKISSEAFIDLMQSDNYAEAFFYLHYRTQSMISRAAMLADFVFFGESKDWAEFVLNIHSEHEVQLNSAIYAFDQAMAYLRENGGHYVNWWDDWRLDRVSAIHNNTASCLFVTPNKDKKLTVIVKMTEAKRWKVVYGKDMSNSNVKFWPISFQKSEAQPGADRENRKQGAEEQDKSR